ncbi:hypothetical protein JCM10450v2_002798 [Rhodotorula kratochvilovae]
MPSAPRTSHHVRQSEHALSAPQQRMGGQAPSTSKIPYSPSRPFSSAAPRRHPALVATVDPPAPRTSAVPALQTALDSPSPQGRKDALRAVCSELEALVNPSSAPLDLPRSNFDALFARVVAVATDEPAFAIPVLKRLRDLAQRRQGWALTLPQAQAVLAARVEQAENELKVQRRRGWFGKGGAKDGGKLRARWRYIDECAEEYWALCEVRLEAGDAVAEAERAEAAKLLERYARAVASRISTALPLDTNLPLARLSVRFYLHVFSLLPPSSPSDAPAPDHPASAPLVPLFASDRSAALAHLRALLEHGRLPSATNLRAIVTAHYAERDAALVASTSSRAAQHGETDEEAAYAHARSVLDKACTSSSSARRGGGDALDALLQRRLERVERAEALSTEPVLFFVRWLGVDLPAEEGASVDTQREMLECAMRLWEASQVQGRSEWDVPARRYARSRVARLLEALVLEAVRLEGVAAPPRGEPQLASSCLAQAAQLAMRYLQHHILVHHATPLFRAVTVSAHAPALALELFDLLSTPPSPTSPNPPFAWSANLLPAFTSLFFSATAALDTSLPLRLYLSWTSSGLSFPVGLWPELWRAAGRRGSVDELRRLVHDWEETGRGPVAARIMRFVLVAASSKHPGTRAPRVVAPLRMLRFFRARYVPSPGSAPSPLLLHSQPYLVVPLAGYEAVLRTLATAHTDRRRALRTVWHWMTLDGHAPSTAAYNALIRASVSRPRGQFSLADLDGAGLAYNALVSAARAGGPAPDGETFALLVRGFARVAAGGAAGAQSRRKRAIALEAAVRTLEAAVGRRLHLPGAEVALLVRLLARAGRFEDAKTAQERWWAGVVALETSGGGVWGDREVEKGMREVRRARDEALLIEARWMAEGRERPEEVDEEAVEEDLVEEAEAEVPSPSAPMSSPLP